MASSGLRDDKPFQIYPCGRGNGGHRSYWKMGAARGLPTGQNNIHVTYRKGIGTEGNVEAEQLTTLLTRPLGVKEATNPLAASGGDDSELLVDARRNAPLTVLTLERAVSLQDYEDFSRAFAGVAKALATWIWDGTRRSLNIT